MDEYSINEYYTNKQYSDGYDAAADGKPCPATADQEFQRGYFDFHADMTRSESRGIA